MQVQRLPVKIGSLVGDDKGQTLKNGLYRLDGKIYGSRYGTLQRKTQIIQGKQTQTLNVEPYNNSKKGNTGLNVGDILICRVVRIKQQGAWVEVLQINTTACHSLIEGFIRRQVIRQKQIDKIKVHQSFLPGDIIRAKFTSFGDGRRIYLSTAAQDLGVVYAKSNTSGKLMLPFSWTQMVCLQTGLKQPRKVSKPSL